MFELGTLSLTRALDAVVKPQRYCV